MSDLVGTHLGQYHLLRLLGKGGMAEVYLAYDEAMQREVAIKIISGTNTDYLERFMREVAAIDKLTHPHILPAYDYDSEGPWRYLVMLYTPYGTLRDLMEQGPLSPTEALELVEQIADALQFAHDHGIVHRDIKPSNILLRDAHYAYLADFGVAKFVESSSHLTQTGILLGTPEYMAPDLATGPATCSTDIYALGIVLYQMVTGQSPFVGETPVAVYWKQLHEQPLPPSRYQPDLSAAIDEVILHALEKDPQRRFQSALELAAAFSQAVQQPEHYLDQARRRKLKLLKLRAKQEKRARLRLTRHSTPVRALHSRRSAIQPTRLHESEQSVVAPEVVTTDEERSEAFTLSPLPLRHRSRERANNLETPYPGQPVSSVIREQRHIKPHRRTSIVVSIVALGLLLFIGLPMTYIYYLFETSHSATASFSNADHPQQEKQPTQSAAATPTVSAVTRGAPLLQDSLADNSHGRWAEDSTHCNFSGGSYHVQVQQTNFLQSCPLLNRFLDNAVVQVNVSLRSGSNAGLLLRVRGERFYDFEINDQGQFFFRRHDSGGGSTYTTLIAPTTSSAILPGGLPNTLLVVANGANFSLYINNTFVGAVQDSTYASGQIALAAGTLAPVQGGEGSFTQLKIFKTV